MRNPLFWMVRAVRSTGLLRTIDRRLRVDGLQATRASLGRSPARTPARVIVDPRRHARRQALLLSRLARVVPGNTSCLRQSLACQTLLRHDGIDTTVHIGIKRVSPGTYEMHAWVVDEEGPVLDDPATLEEFRITHRLDAQ